MDLRKQVQSKSLPPSPNESRGPKGRIRDYSGLPWSNYFTDSSFIQQGTLNSFHYYACESSNQKAPLLVLLHGAGYSGLSWSLFSKEIRKYCDVAILAIDLRGHGLTVSENESDLSLCSLSQDVIYIIHEYNSLQRNVVLVGHSLGGAVAVEAGTLGIRSLLGVVVIDVVEGTALEALGSMNSFLKGRPSSFDSVSKAVEWSVRAKQVKNLESARVSVPGQLKNSSSQKPVSIENFQNKKENESESSRLQTNTIPEDEEEFSDPSSSLKSSQLITWRVNLFASQKYWRGWFENLSSKFLELSASKLLLLAGVDRLDRELTVGQMQGKFQMALLPLAGHVIHEDLPDKVAQVIANYLNRNKLVKLLIEIPSSFPGC